MLRFELFSALVLALASCQPAPANAGHAPDVRPPRETNPLLAGSGGVQFIAAADQGDVAELIHAKEGQVASTMGRLLVYVGASWCEPCQYFHRAVEAHALDRDFPGLRLLEFDLDRDAERLRAAGYAPRMIPLFAVPGADGRASGRQMEGSIHGPSSVQEIVPRLRALLGT